MQNANQVFGQVFGWQPGQEIEVKLALPGMLRQNGVTEAAVKRMKKLLRMAFIPCKDSLIFF